MCLAIPGKIVKIEGSTATIEYGLETRKANTSLIKNIKIGDYVIASAGFVMEQVEKEQALKSIKEWENAGKQNGNS